MIIPNAQHDLLNRNPRLLQLRNGVKEVRVSTETATELILENSSIILPNGETVHFKINGLGLGIYAVRLLHNSDEFGFRFDTHIVSAF